MPTRFFPFLRKSVSVADEFVFTGQGSCHFVVTAYAEALQRAIQFALHASWKIMVHIDSCETVHLGEKSVGAADQFLGHDNSQSSCRS